MSPPIPVDDGSVRESTAAVVVWFEGLVVLGREWEGGGGLSTHGYCCVLYHMYHTLPVSRNGPPRDLGGGLKSSYSSIPTHPQNLDTRLRG